jgi:hypothetical protein
MDSLIPNIPAFIFYRDLFLSAVAGWETDMKLKARSAAAEKEFLILHPAIPNPYFIGRTVKFSKATWMFDLP